MNAIALDDEPLALEVVRSHASKVPFLNLKAEFTDAFKAMEYIQKENIDLIFLDIKMPDISGIDFMNSLNKKPMVIFTTAYSEHAVTSFELDAIDYLLKPFSLSRFVKGCNKAYELFQLRNKSGSSDFIFLKTGYEQEKVQFDDILYLEAAGNYVNFVLKSKSLLSRMTFAELEVILPKNKFIRIHRSYMVAVSAINRIERHQVHINDIQIPVSESYMTNLNGLDKR
ncbi:MAG: DNA-binding response regulator [Sphingobacteriales bacterium 17-39-43]|uniref:LytR/AlgR family response regulator transcription factor n=1 Tax=Daejeonella sp. TaxID=2805397 RepID=UPI000BC42849|nr:LytTR family DNA-binding domain-containing protein [Daejeonella sp.]OYX96023.1 MAG: DNA-binding response regulator [Sphingobacteriia bacterium 35-40-5]OYZ33095.1 MAG: DNA-binding response regulator [Sphingobacteriales bacterium 16-39-50]OZA26504.1 MAG: DNA-binding response regulator [Sphingobacteriales bacterium 17-39-43]OZA60603.1 MAG: DNA-binding response regulator [Sphingobacteriales bacterium 39-40-5]HQS51372.1 LytTR family DNA-binding domain-containing protein [Daejeonella sp.]